MAVTMALMPVHSEWLDLVLKPALLDRQYVASKSESSIFDLMVHLINNGLSLAQATNNSQVVASTTGNGSSNGQLTVSKEDQEYRSFVETRKLNTIRFLIFKLLSYFDWNLTKILENVPSTHQEFLFTEFRLTFDGSLWKSFANLMYNRWVQRLVLKSAFPSKPSRVLQFSSNVNPQVIDPYYVPPELHENLINRVKSYSQVSVLDVENLLNEWERGQKPFDILVPTMDCFQIKEGDTLDFSFKNSLRPDPVAFLDEVYYELGQWFFIKEEYQHAARYFAKIKTSKSTFVGLEGYKAAARLMIDDRYVVPDPKQLEPKESLEKKIVRYVNTLVKERANVYDEDYRQFDARKVAAILKRLAEETRRSQNGFIYDRVIKYFLIKISSTGDAQLEQQCRAIFYGSSQQESKGDDMEGVIEEGEIGDWRSGAENDEENLFLPLDGEDANELLLLNAFEPEQILALIPSIKRPPLVVNRNWALPGHQASLLFTNMPQLDKCHIVLAKANELRKAKFYSQSRTLYLMLLEDIQTSNPRLARTIHHEILFTDLLTFFDVVPEEQVGRSSELNGRCRQYLAAIDIVDKATQLLELVCLFLLDHSEVRLEFSMIPIDVLQFSACLAATSEAQRDRAKEFWDFLLYSFIPPAKQPQVNGHPKIVFFASLANFLAQLKRNIRVMMVAATALVKIYNQVNENPTQVIQVCTTFDFFPVSIPPSLVNQMDKKEIGWTLEECLRSFIEAKPEDVYLMKYYGDYLCIEGSPHQAMQYYVAILAQHTKYFSNWDSFDHFDEMVIGQMIVCATKLSQHLLVAVLYQFLKEPDYGLAFKALNQFMGGDSTEDLLECIWDVTMLEYLINLYHRRALGEREAKAIQLMQQLDLNSNNSEPVLKEAAALRKGRLMRMLARLFMP